MIKKFKTSSLVLCVILLFSYSAFATNDDFSAYLSRYVDQGVVNYKEMQFDRGPLDEYLRGFEQIEYSDFERWDEMEQISYLINLYNASTLKLILDHYPVKSIKEIRKFFAGPWDQEFITLFGKDVTLNFIEHEMLRKQYQEPRIHFALVCAARSCPPLRSEVYKPEKLGEQLDDQGVIFFSQESKNNIDVENKILYLSPIFKWFKKDFEKKSGSVVNFIKPYFKGYKIDDSWKIKYTDYDWSLNGKS